MLWRPCAWSMFCICRKHQVRNLDWSWFNFFKCSSRKACNINRTYFCSTHFTCCHLITIERLRDFVTSCFCQSVFHNNTHSKREMVLEEVTSFINSYWPWHNLKMRPYIRDVFHIASFCIAQPRVYVSAYSPLLWNANALLHDSVVKLVYQYRMNSAIPFQNWVITAMTHHMQRSATVKVTLQSQHFISEDNRALKCNDTICNIHFVIICVTNIVFSVFCKYVNNKIELIYFFIWHALRFGFLPNAVKN